MGSDRLTVGVVPDPVRHPHWSRFKAFLDPAAELGRNGPPEPLVGPHELVWAVYDGSEPIAAATTRMLVDDTAEVVLVGGVAQRRWLSLMDQTLSAWALDEGATCIRATGRKGWSRILGWTVIGSEGGMMRYEKGLAS